MNAAETQSDERPWYRQFWPWFVVALPATAVVASLITVWIAVDARPNRIDGYGALSVPVEFSPDRRTLRFDLGAPAADAWRPATIAVTLIARRGGATQELLAARLDERRYETPIGPIEPGLHDLRLRSASLAGGMHGVWSYPAPVWRLLPDD